MGGGTKTINSKVRQMKETVYQMMTAEMSYSHNITRRKGLDCIYGLYMDCIYGLYITSKHNHPAVNPLSTFVINTEGHTQKSAKVGKMHAFFLQRPHLAHTHIPTYRVPIIYLCIPSSC